jgi:plasmid stabilization system protein ParE
LFGIAGRQSHSWGNDYGLIKPGLLRYEDRSHAIDYQPTGDGILVVRVLGGKQNPTLHIASK